MRAIILIILFISCFHETSFAQIYFKIDKLTLSHYNFVVDDKIIDESLEDGPYVHLRCVIINNSHDSLLLYPAHSTTRILFRYNNSDYSVEVVPLPFVDQEKLIIPPGGKTELFFGTHPLINTPMFNRNKGDYRREMLFILPTIKAVYEEKNFLIQTVEIREVVLE